MIKVLFSCIFKFSPKISQFCPDYLTRAFAKFAKMTNDFRQLFKSYHFSTTNCQFFEPRFSERGKFQLKKANLSIIAQEAINTHHAMIRGDWFRLFFCKSWLFLTRVPYYSLWKCKKGIFASIQNLVFFSTTTCFLEPRFAWKKIILKWFYSPHIHIRPWSKLFFGNFYDKP